MGDWGGLWVWIGVGCVWGDRSGLWVWGIGVGCGCVG